MKPFSLIIILFISALSFSQEQTYTDEELSVSKFIDGTLLKPKETTKTKLAIIIAGSGPTDRNGNQNFLKNDALKKLAVGLTKNGIATFRYDKRVVKQIRQGNVDPNIMFDDFVSDAKDVITYFKTSGSFEEIYIIGHSQGSLVGMLNANEDVDGFISIAGAGQNIGDVIVEQVTNMAPQLGEAAKKVVDQLKKGERTTDYPQALASVFNADIQEFMINWMQYYPTEIIKELEMPVLIVNGTKDLQVSEAEAKLLKDANENAELVIIKNMNHVFFEIEGDDLENSKSYNEIKRPIATQLVQSIVDFINP
ncbi:alpha/beta hydrolase family protein [Winogradskyella tangerina]|uniref:alpha/beta hydrolase family protein n=1 Tax=Winogradskyella tangerina TaxID=2023240 RepID=UPI000DBE26F6|nr:alpha/beta hydrolase [Winogradskyella tangerina]